MSRAAASLLERGPWVACVYIAVVARCYMYVETLGIIIEVSQGRKRRRRRRMIHLLFVVVEVAVIQSMPTSFETGRRNGEALYIIHTYVVCLALKMFSPPPLFFSVEPNAF